MRWRIASDSFSSRIPKLFFLLALLIHPFCANAEEDTLEIERIYLEAQVEGASNEFYAYQDYMFMFIEHPLAAWEIRGIVEDVFKSFDSYWDKLKKISRKHLEETASIYIRENICPVAQKYHSDRGKMTNCLLMGLFGIGDIEDKASHKKIQNLVVEFMVKKRISGVIWEEDIEKTSFLNKKLEEKKLSRLLQICQESNDSFLHHTFYNELCSCKTMNDYVQGFDLKLLKSLTSHVFNEESETSGHLEIKNVYLNFSEEVERLKVEYGAFLDFS